MPRVTRSKKFEIAEDQTAQKTQIIAPAPALEALAEINNTAADVMATATEESVATQLKGLKAAYRNAIGAGKKGRKGKGKRKGKNEDLEDSEETIAGEHVFEQYDETAANGAIGDVTQASQLLKGEFVLHGISIQVLTGFRPRNERRAAASGNTSSSQYTPAVGKDSCRSVHFSQC